MRIHDSKFILVLLLLRCFLYQGLEGSDVLREAINLAHDLLLLGLRVVLDLLLELSDLTLQVLNHLFTRL